LVNPSEVSRSPANSVTLNGSQSGKVSRTFMVKRAIARFFSLSLVTSKVVGSVSIVIGAVGGGRRL
jgi:hypothetical protein